MLETCTHIYVCSMISVPFSLPIIICTHAYSRMPHAPVHSLHYPEAMDSIMVTPSHLLFPRDCTKWFVDKVTIHNSSSSPVALGFEVLGMGACVADATGTRISSNCKITVPSHSCITITIQTHCISQMQFFSMLNIIVQLYMQSKHARKGLNRTHLMFQSFMS